MAAFWHQFIRRLTRRSSVRLPLMRERAYITDEIHQDLAGRVKYNVMRRSIDFEEFLLRRPNMFIKRLHKSFRRCPIRHPGKEEHRAFKGRNIVEVYCYELREKNGRGTSFAQSCRLHVVIAIVGAQ